MNREAETLSLFDLTSASLNRRDVDLESPYDRIITDPAGEYVLLGFDESNNQECVACNLSELGVVDLSGQLPETAEFVTLTNRATDVVFAEPFQLGGSEQRLAIAMAENQVTLIDLKALAAGDMDNALREIPIAVDASRSKRPIQVIVEPDSNDDSVHLYLLTEPGSDIIDVSIQPNPSSGDDQKFNIRINNQFAAGQQPTEMTLFESDRGGKKILAVDRGEPQFTLVDLSSGDRGTFPLPSNQPARNLLTYRVDGENTDEGGEVRVLAYSDSYRNATVIYPERISVGDQPALVGRNMKTLKLAKSPSRIEFASEGTSLKAIAYHRDGVGPGFSVLDLKDNTVVSIKGANLDSVIFSPTFAYGTFQGRANVGKFELETSHPSVFELPNPGRSLSLDTEDELLLVQHRDETGAFTVLDANEPETARVFYNVFIKRIMNRGVP